MRQKSFAMRCFLVLSSVARSFRRAGLFRFFPFHGNELRDARLLHCYAVENRTHFHRLAIMRHDDELRLPTHVGEHFVEAAHVGFVERRVHFVEDAEGTWLITEHRDEQRERRERFFAA